MITWAFLSTWVRARFGDTERGASLVEYAFLAALIAVVCIAAMALLGGATSSTLDGVGSSVGSAS
ncbi:MAG: Flp family type IVb pilin [Acidimicrobiales bacterium]|nr:Flp family type IVb pilin [Acidimicrobiales bacterium]